MSASKRIKSTDEGYAEILAAWVTNGRPSQFEIFFSETILGDKEGGALFQVLDISAEEPDFYMRWSRAPTLFNENSASERPTQEGWLLTNRKFWKQKFWRDRKRRGGRLRTSMKDAPNDLA